MILTHQQGIDEYWTTEMAMPHQHCPVAQDIEVTEQKLYSGVQLFMRNGCLVIAAPPERAHRIAKCVRELAPHEVFDVEFVKRILSPDVGKILGPAQVGYADESTFRQTDKSGYRLLVADDGEVLGQFASALKDDELEQSGFEAAATPPLGASQMALSLQLQAFRFGSHTLPTSR